MVDISKLLDEGVGTQDTSDRFDKLKKYFEEKSKKEKIPAITQRQAMLLLGFKYQPMTNKFLKQLLLQEKLVRISDGRKYYYTMPKFIKNKKLLIELKINSLKSAKGAYFVNSEMRKNIEQRISELKSELERLSQNK